jgi:hypothetical protein
LGEGLVSRSDSITQLNALQALKEEFERICVEAGLGKIIASQIAAPLAIYMLSEFGGERLPKITRAYPVASIQADAQRMSMRAIRRKYNIGQATLYRLLGIKLA